MGATDFLKLASAGSSTGGFTAAAAAAEAASNTPKAGVRKDLFMSSEGSADRAARPQGSAVIPARRVREREGTIRHTCHYAFWRVENPGDFAPSSQGAISRLGSRN